MFSKRELVVLIAVILQRIIADESVAPTSDLSGRGQDGERGQFPYLAVLLSYTANIACSGSLLSDRWVISTVTCTQNAPVESSFIVVGAVSTLEGDSYICDGIKTHENYNSTTSENNIALFHSNRAILFSQYVQPISYFRGQSEPCRTTHVGYKEVRNAMISYGNYWISYMNVSKISTKECQSLWSNIGRRESYNPTSFCVLADIDDSKDDHYQNALCLGRGGEPLVATDSRVLLGLQYEFGGCNNVSPFVFTDVSQFGDWIEAATNVRGVDVL